jgi:SnoaL-like domain
MPTPDDFTRWLDGYRDAFIRLDPKAAGELFANDASYQESPFAEPIKGRARIVVYWEMVAGVIREVEFDFDILAVAGEVGVAHVRDTLTRVPSGKRAQDGIFFARFDNDLRCVEFREWWGGASSGIRAAHDVAQATRNRQP